MTQITNKMTELPDRVFIDCCSAYKQAREKYYRNPQDCGRAYESCSAMKGRHWCSKDLTATTTETQTEEPQPPTPSTLDESRQLIKASTEVIRTHQAIITREKERMRQMLIERKEEIIREQQELGLKMAEIESEIAMEEFTL